MASIRRRGDRWQVQVRRRGHYPLTRTFRTRENAEVWARQMEAEVDRTGLPFDPRQRNNITLSSLLTRYEAEITPTKRGAFQERYRIHQLTDSRIGSLALAQVTPANLARFRDERLECVSPATVRRELAILSHVLETARRDWSVPIGDNPLKLIELPKPSQPRARRLAGGEWDRLMNGCSQSRYKAAGIRLATVIELATETAMRRGEILAGRWKHINLDARTWYLPQTKNGHARTVPLSPRAVAILMTAKCPDIEPESPVIGMSANALRLAWERLCKRAGIEDLHFHDLRHEAISRFFEGGLSVSEVAAISGHRDFRMLARYTHLRAEDIAQKLAKSCHPLVDGRWD